MAQVAPVNETLDIALVVPVHGDTEALGRLLEQVARWDARPAEIVVAAAGADPDVERLCASHGARLVACEAANRGAQLDAGARAASAGVLWFVHATAELPARGLAVIASLLDAGAESGCFRFRFQGPRRPLKALLERLVALRIRCGGVPYGDQALFAARTAYRACGGFAHTPLFEEVALVRRLRNRGTFRIASLPVGVATRRWERDGWLRRSLENRRLALRHAFGAPAATLAREYRSGRAERDTLRDVEVRD